MSWDSLIEETESSVISNKENAFLQILRDCEGGTPQVLCPKFGGRVLVLVYYKSQYIQIKIQKCEQHYVEQTSRRSQVPQVLCPKFGGKCLLFALLNALIYADRLIIRANI